MTRRVSLAEASRYWFQLGWISFGGPAGQIALMHQELVERRRWLSERRYLHALNYCMVLPGPEAIQLATYLGWLMHGVRGGLVAGGLFLLPSVIVLIALSSIYVLWGQLPLLAAVFWALKPAVLAIVVQAGWRLGRRTLHTQPLVWLAVVAFLAFSVLQWPYPLVIALAALAGWAAGRWQPTWLALPEAQTPVVAFQNPSQPNPIVETSTGDVGEDFIHGDATPTPAHARFSKRHLALTLLVWGCALGLPLLALGLINGWDGPLVAMGRFFSQVALVTFGGAYAVLPYVAKAAVGHFDWLSASQMVDGLALGETTPGPLIIVVAFVGFMGGWNTGVFSAPGHWWDAVAATLVVVWFTFLPSFGFILVGGPLVEATRDNLRLGAPLRAITAAVVGVIGSLVLFFAAPVLWPAGPFDWAPAGLVVLALVLLLRWRWSVLQLIGGAALVGLGRYGLAQLGHLIS
jgi:chromate transporter|uniref:chromate efflux transporter n=1 Tax=Cyanobium sp. TaxID=2164130 RepID=UPI00404875FE